MALHAFLSSMSIKAILKTKDLINVNRQDEDGNMKRLSVFQFKYFKRIEFF